LFTVGRTIALTTLALMVVWALYLARQMLAAYLHQHAAGDRLIHAIEHQRVILVGTRR
jgi:hypothetical protein